MSDSGVVARGRLSPAGSVYVCGSCGPKVNCAGVPDSCVDGDGDICFMSKVT
ncbi:hypothetical protein KIPB_014808, partial [Kipferlia bialata]|eukprot:g14808.t1